jgi:hypothetical protein
MALTSGSSSTSIGELLSSFMGSGPRTSLTEEELEALGAGGGFLEACAARAALAFRLKIVSWAAGEYWRAGLTKALPPAICIWRQHVRQVGGELGVFIVEGMLPPVWMGPGDPAEILISF